MADESTPLLAESGSSDPHGHFCMLVGIPPFGKVDASHPSINDRALYKRVTRKHKSQNLTYNFTAALSNTLLLSQVVLGATLTALGASESSHILITIFGVLNTIIAGLVAYLKSRGQPMRARMFRDDLEHVVNEIENSKTMWLGIKNKIHGYDEIDVDDKVSVRSEVARLTRLYESQVKKHAQNNPDLYNTGGTVLDPITGLRARPAAGAQLPQGVPIPAGVEGSVPASAPAAVPTPTEDPDESPATAKDNVKTGQSSDESPATAKSDGKNGDKDKEREELPKSKSKSQGSPHPSNRSTASKSMANSSRNAGSPVGADAEPASATKPPVKDGHIEGS